MGEPRNEVARRRKGVAFREADDRRTAVAISGRNQHDGFAPKDGDGAGAGERRRSRPGNSADSKSQTSDRSSRGMEPAQTRAEFAPCPSEACKGRTLPGNRPYLRSKSNLKHQTSNIPRRSSDPEVLAEGWRAVHYPAERAHTRPGNRRAECRHVSDADLRRPNDWNALAGA